jgi:hypothetical protein
MRIASDEADPNDNVQKIFKHRQRLLFGFADAASKFRNPTRVRFELPDRVRTVWV